MKSKKIIFFVFFFFNVSTNVFVGTGSSKKSKKITEKKVEDKKLSFWQKIPYEQKSAFLSYFIDFLVFLKGRSYKELCSLFLYCLDNSTSFNFSKKLMGPLLCWGAVDENGCCDDALKAITSKILYENKDGVIEVRELKELPPALLLPNINAEDSTLRDPLCMLEEPPKQGESLDCNISTSDQVVQNVFLNLQA